MKFSIFLKSMKIMKFMAPMGRRGFYNIIALNPGTYNQALDERH